MASPPLLPVSAPSSRPFSSPSSPGPASNGKGRLATLRSGLADTRSPSPPAQHALGPSPSDGEVSEKSSLWRAYDVDGESDGVAADGSVGRRRRRLMSLPVVVAFVICLVYLFCALAGIGYVDPSSLAPGPRPLLVPESWSSEPSRHQRQQAYAQAIGLSKGPSLEELKKMWG